MSATHDPKAASAAPSAPVPTDESIAKQERPRAGGDDDARRLDDLQTAQDAGDFGASGEPG